MSDAPKNDEAFFEAFKALPEDARDFSLGKEERNGLRKIVTAHPAWDSYRKGWTYQGKVLDASTLTKPRMEHFCYLNGINVLEAVANRAPDAPKAPKPSQDAPKLPMTSEDAPKAPVAPAPAPVIVAPVVPEAPRDFAPAGSSGLEAMLANLIGPSILGIVKGDVERIVQAAIGEMPATIIKVRDNAGQERKVEGARHPLLETLLRALSAPMSNGHFVNVWLAGPTGSGKTHAAKQVAGALGLTYHFTGASSMAFELTGFIDAGGHYHETEFVKAYRDGGLWLGDEIDAWDNSALLALNAALANGEMSTPIGLIKRHVNFRCIAAANTFGAGATSDFVGRAKIDAAFLSRFPVKLSWNYDEAFERSISGNPEFSMRVQMARKRAQDAGLKIIIDPRHGQAGAALIAAGFSADEAANLTYLAGLKPEQIKMIEARR